MLVPSTIRRSRTKMHATMYQAVGKLSQQTLTAANVCTTGSSRLFVTDRATKEQYLIDTGSDLSVFPRKLLPECRGPHRLLPVRGQRDHHPHLRMDLQEPETRTVSQLHMGLHRSRRIAPHHRCGFPDPFEPTRRLQKQPSSRQDHLPVHAVPRRNTCSPQHQNHSNLGQPPSGISSANQANRKSSRGAAQYNTPHPAHQYHVAHAALLQTAWR
jgi:hypothetical protein